MPCAVEFPIGDGKRPPPNLYRALYANLLQWITAANADVTEAFHNRPVRKPFTISALRRGCDGDWYWRVTLLQDDLWEPLWTGVQAVGVLDLDGCLWPVRWPDAQVTHLSYDFLLTHVQHTDRIRMRFLSPTTFRAGDLDVPLPEPRAVFQSWLNRWNDFAPTHRRINTELLDVVRATVAISAHQLRTEEYDLGHTQAVGFVGQVTYVILQARRLNQALVWQLNALADYAEFCGTGQHTAQGMGQTRRYTGAGDIFISGD